MEQTLTRPWAGHPIGTKLVAAGSVRRGDAGSAVRVDGGRLKILAAAGYFAAPKVAPPVAEPGKGKGSSDG